MRHGRQCNIFSVLSFTLLGLVYQVVEDEEDGSWKCSCYGWAHMHPVERAVPTVPAEVAEAAGGAGGVLPILAPTFVLVRECRHVRFVRYGEVPAENPSTSPLPPGLRALMGLLVRLENLLRTKKERRAITRLQAAKLIQRLEASVRGVHHVYPKGRNAEVPASYEAGFDALLAMSLASLVKSGSPYSQQKKMLLNEAIDVCCEEVKRRQRAAGGSGSDEDLDDNAVAEL